METQLGAGVARTETVTLDDGSTLIFDVRGSGSAVLLIHGWACRRSDWLPIATDLADDYTVIAVDLPGHGEATTARPWTIKELSNLIANLVDHLGFDAVSIAGHSMGGAVALEAAVTLQGKCRAVVAVDSLTYLSIYPSQGDSAFLPGVEAMAQDFEGAMVRLVEAVSAEGTSSALKATVAAEMAEAEPELAIPLLIDLYRWDMDAALAENPSPLTILAAECQLAPEARLRFASRADLRVVDLGGHFFLRERPLETADALRAVLADSR